MDKKPWNIDKESLDTIECKKVHARFDAARSQMRQRTYHHELYGLLAKNKSVHEWIVTKGKGKQKYFSEGSTQYILRKVLADTIQRVPDGELVTQYDKLSWQNIVLQYIFDNKIMSSEIDGISMMSNLTKSFKMSFIYAFAPVRTGFEKDYDDDVIVKYSLENWADVYINPDCEDICHADVVYFRQYLSKDEVKNLLDENGNILDSTYNEKTVKYVLENKMFSGKQFESEKMADKMKGSTALQSLELITEYCRGAKEFVTFVPAIDAVFRKVPNYDPRMGIPWNFLVLEPDADFPIGVSQVEFLLADQQFNDLFQTSAFKNLLLAMEPPLMVSGWETNPSSYKYEPRKIWNLGNNPNNKVEPVKIENSILNNWSTTRESIAASMLRNLNVMDGTIANDSGVGFSKTAPGVEAQTNAKTININQYQKRVEDFMSDWACKALRMFINSMKGVHKMTVDESTRRKLYDIGRDDMVLEDNKIEVDFSELSADMLEFKVRTGSLVQRKEDQELEKLSQMVQPFVQNLNGWSDENRKVVENDILLPVAMRMVELSDTDIANTLADSLSSQIAKNMMAGMQQQIDGQQDQINGQQMQIDDQAQQIAAMQNPDMQEPQAQEASPSQMPVPTSPDINPDGGLGNMGGGALPSQPPLDQEETPGKQVKDLESLLVL